MGGVIGNVSELEREYRVPIPVGLLLFSATENTLGNVTHVLFLTNYVLISKNSISNSLLTPKIHTILYNLDLNNLYI